MRAGGIILAGVVGLLFGSFANVVIWRVPRKESVVHPGSHCPSCDAALRPWENVPVLSWFALRGRCSHCGARISIRYPLVELVTASVFALAAALLPRATDLIAYLPVLWVLIVLSFIDFDHKLLPNRIVLPAVGAAVVLFGFAALAGPGLQAWIRSLGGGAAAFGFLLILAVISPRGMGMGDVKLAALLGMTLAYLDRGYGRLFIGLMLSFLAGAVGGLLLIAVRRGGMKSQIPFGPYLTIGTLAGVFWGDALLRLWLGH